MHITKISHHALESFDKWEQHLLSHSWAQYVLYIYIYKVLKIQKSSHRAEVALLHLEWRRLDTVLYV